MQKRANAPVIYPQEANLSKNQQRPNTQASGQQQINIQCQTTFVQSNQLLSDQKTTTQEQKTLTPQPTDKNTTFLKTEHPEPIQDHDASSLRYQRLSVSCFSGGEAQDFLFKSRAPCHPHFENFDETELTTCIDELTYLQFQSIIAYLVAPLLVLMSCCTFGLFLLWNPKFRAKFFYKRVNSLTNATHIQVQGRDGNFEVVTLQEDNQSFSRDKADLQEGSWFQYRFIKFRYAGSKDKIQGFHPVKLPIYGEQQKLLQQFGQGIKESDVEKFQAIYGRCVLDVPRKGILELIFTEILSPFYIFQIYAIILWIWEGYYTYDSCIIFITIAGIIQYIYTYVTNIESIRRLARFECPITVKRIRNGEAEFKQINSGDLVPGDVVVVPDQCLLPCDLILLSGQCIVNESMLTGESVPVVKNCIKQVKDLFDPNNSDSSKKHTLFSGTKVIQAKDMGNLPEGGSVKYNPKGREVQALVIRTGYVTMKGALVRDILYPKPTKFTFQRDAMVFVVGMALLAIVGVSVSLPHMISIQTSEARLYYKFLDLVTITVVPSLPATMAVGIAFAIARLRAQKIYCIAPPRVNLAGRINIMVFDKTGTLTEDGLQMYGVKPVLGKIQLQSEEKAIKPNFMDFFENILDCPKLRDSDSANADQTLMSNEENFKRSSSKINVPFVLQPPKEINRAQILYEVMAACHSLTFIRGDIVGDPLDVKMFESTQWQLVEAQKVKQAINFDPSQFIGFLNEESTNSFMFIARRFDFESKLQRMSVVARKSNGYYSFVKGSPEKIIDLCQPETIPEDYASILDSYTRKGYRVIAAGMKSLHKDIKDDDCFQKINDLSREYLESNLHFLGFIVMENKVKAATFNTIQTLNDCKVRTIMATGDNILTAIAVGKDCNILNKDLKKVYFGDLDEVKGESKIIWRDADMLEQEQSDVLDEGSIYKRRNSVTQDIFEGSSASRRNSMIKQNFPDSEIKLEAPLLKAKERLDLVKEHSVRTAATDGQFETRFNFQNMDERTEVPWEIMKAKQGTFGVAFSGKALAYMLQNRTEYEVAILKVLAQAQVYARMAPDDKASLVRLLQVEMETQVGMCGDGANDCAALKQADAGISLSEAEASIAAPFTSKVQDISCVITLLLEGRCSLATTFSGFKFIQMYSLIQYMTILLLYHTKSGFNDWQFFYVDVGALIPLCIFQSWTGSSKKLTSHLPEQSLFAIPVILSLFGMAVIQFGFLFYVFQTHEQEINNYQTGDDKFYTCEGSQTKDPDPKCSSNTVMFLFSSQMYTICCLCYSISYPFRKPIWTNPIFLVSLILLSIYNVYRLIDISEWETELYQLVPLPKGYRNKLLWLSIPVFIASYSFEKLFIGWFQDYMQKRENQKLKQRIDQKLYIG